MKVGQTVFVVHRYGGKAMGWKYWGHSLTHLAAKMTQAQLESDGFICRTDSVTVRSL